MTLDFHNVKVHNFFWIRVEIMPTLLAENIEKAPSVNEDQNGGMTARTSSDITQEFEETSCLKDLGPP